MRELFSFIFDRITDPLGLPIEAWKEWIILLIIEEVAFRVAYSVVGDMYRSRAISSKFGGSFFHWVIRFVVLVVIWGLAYGAIKVWQFYTVHGVPVVRIAGGFLVSGIIVGTVIHSLRGGTRNA